MSAELSPESMSAENTAYEQLLYALDGAVVTEDYEFATQLTSGQLQMKPYELAKHMNQRRRESAGSPDAVKWEIALRVYLNGLSGRIFPPSEQIALQSVSDSLDRKFFSSVAEEDRLYRSSEPGQQLMLEAGPADKQVHDWDRDNFFVNVEPGDLHRYRANPAFVRAEELSACNIEAGMKPDLDGAIKALSLINSPKLRERMHKALDEYVFEWAEALAAGAVTGYMDVQEASRVIDTYMSSDDIKDRAHAAIDKFVFEKADQMAHGHNGSGAMHPQYAVDFIHAFASTSGRAQAMLNRLGLA